ncbi:hypothetical protein ElyMa_005990900 [Elysia marginata]|uniref:Uncharacterized protein n=1 Tax=Elysia marginata TaxID=1093978 RepID=A0AAV4GFE8_9GAST|nr:hypothetical protein ElyMa_005990900 [Elysia marginata]
MELTGNALCMTTVTNVSPRSLKRTRTQTLNDASAPRSNKIGKYAGEKLCFAVEAKHQCYPDSEGYDLNKNGLSQTRSPSNMPWSQDPLSCHWALNDKHFNRAPNSIHNQNTVFNEHLSPHPVLNNGMMLGHETQPHLAVINCGNSAYHEETCLQVSATPKQPNPSFSMQEESVRRCPECAAGKPGHIGHLGRQQQMDTS